MKLRIKIFSLIFLSLLFSCKKDKDTAAPKISISTPQENSSFSVFDTLLVQAKITDETQLKTASVQLVEENLTPAQTAEIRIISGKEYDFKTDYAIYEQQLESGFYFLKISASDGINEAKEYVKIYITEAQTTSKGIVLISVSGFQTVDISIYDDSIQPFLTVSSDYASSCVSSKYQYINILGEVAGGLNSYKISSKTVQWDVPSIGSQKYFEHLDFYNEINYVCYYGGNIRGYDNAGSVKFSTVTNSAYRPLKSFLHNTDLFVEETEVSGSAKRLSMYYSTGVFAKSCPIAMDIVAFASKDNDNFFLFGNENGKAKILIYSVSNNSTWSPYALSSNDFISDALQINANLYLVALQDGIYKYTYSPVNFMKFISTNNLQKIKYDEVKNAVVATSGNSLLFFDYNNGQQISAYLHSYTIEDFHLLRNK